MKSEHRYETLDALRGVAAIAVVCFHIEQIKLIPGLTPHGYLAVDFFFVLSGFVIAYAYEDALRGSLTWRDFALRRAVRIYPLAALGATLGLFVLLLKWNSFPEKVEDLPHILVSGTLNLLLLPTPFGGEVSRYELFPGNGPLWSLSFELAANLIWAAWGTRLRTHTLALIVILAGFAVAALTLQAGTANQGFDLATAPSAIARVTYSFPMGVLIYRAHRSAIWPKWIPTGQAMSVLLGGALFGVLALPRMTGVSFAVWDVIAVLVILPTIVLLGIAQGRGSRFGNFLGELSYPLYILHFPILLLASGLHQIRPSQLSAVCISIGAAAIIVIISVVASRFYDIPIRRRLLHAICRKKDIL